MSTATTASRCAYAARALLLSLARAAHRARTAAPRAVRWFLDKPERLLTLAWLGGLLIVGSAARASAQDDIIIGPDLADGSAQTLFEAFSMWDYRLLVKPDEEASGWFDIGAGLWHGLGILNYILLWIVLGLLYGGLTLLAWFLNLTIYRDSAMEIDGAVQMVADHVFWPLIPATVAVGGLIAYARWRGDGRGFLGDLGWVVAATAMAIAFASGPSAIMGQLDQARQTTATAVISGASDYINTSGNPVGYPTPEVGGPPQDAATRTLTDGLWSTFGATPWCYAQFRELDICREAGTHALADDDVWQGWMAELDAGRTPAVFGEQGDYVRGQDITRTGVLLLMAVVSLPLAWMLVRLVMSGLVAVVGFLLMLVLGLLFLTFWPIEGFLRRVGTQYWIYTLGMLLQALFITVAVSGVMVVSTVIASLAGQYGFFLIAVLNVALFAAATKARSWLDMLTTVGGASSGGMATALIARSVARTVVRTVAGAASGGTAAAASAVGAAAGAGRGRDWTQGKGVHPSSLPTPGGGGKGGQNRGQGTGLDNGPLKAQSTRMRQHGSEPQLNATGTALPAGTGGSTLTPAGNNTTAGSTAAGGRRVPPMPGQSPGADSTGSSRRAVSPTDITERPDQTGARNAAAEQRRSGARGRVWVAPPGGSATAPLDSPRPARTRGNTPRITNARNGTWE